MIWLGLVLLILACFGYVLLFGAPYLPTLQPQITAALDLADLKSGQTLLELGCGDGRVVLAAARRGLKVTGYELNPLLAGVAWLRTIKYRQQVTIRCRDFWRADWPPAAAIFTFLLPKYMSKLDKKVERFARQQGRPVKLISFAFQVPAKPAVAERQGVRLYLYR